MTLDVQLGMLESSGLIDVACIEPEPEYTFRHALVQEAAYASLLKADQKRLHLKVGELLERLYADQLDTLAPVLGRHFYEAGEPQRALRYFTLAGDAALQVYANIEAVEHYTRALEIALLTWPAHGGDSSAVLIHLYSNRGRALELSAQYERALSNYAEMEALAHQRSDDALELAALLAQATLYITPNTEFDFARGQALAEKALALARKLGDRAAEARLYWNLMRLLHWRGQGRQALEYGEQSLALARELNQREQLAFILHDIHRPYLATYQRRRAAEVLQEAAQLWRELGNLPMLADALASAADMDYDNGEYARTLALAQEAVHISRSIGNQWGQAFGSMMIGYVHFERGEIAQALEAIEQAIDLSKSAGVVILNLRLRLVLAWIHGTLGNEAAAGRMTETTIADIKRAGLSTPYWIAFPLVILAQLHILRGEFAGAEAILDRINAETQSKGWSAPPWVLRPEAELALAKGDYEHALACSEALIAEYNKSDVHIPVANALYLKGKALRGQGRLAAARETLLTALAEAEMTGSRIEAWPILLALSQLEAQGGPPAAANQFRHRAREIVTFIADHIERPDLRQSFLALPAVRAALEVEQEPIRTAPA